MSLPFLERALSSTTPNGNLEFQYKYRSINLKSIDITWLAVRGNKAVFEGIAALNRKGTFTLGVEATDGDLNGEQPDRFHITIWGGTIIIYDYSNDLPGGSARYTEHNPLFSNNSRASQIAQCFPKQVLLERELFQQQDKSLKLFG